jgi:hypothetical protein
MLWGNALIRQDREADAYLLVTALLARPESAYRYAGVEIALIAIRHWRAAASQLSAALAGALADEALEVRLAAADAIGASLELTRAHADELAKLVDLPKFHTVATMALSRIGHPGAAGRESVGYDALAALRQEAETGHLGCTFDKGGACSLGIAVMAVGRYAPTGPTVTADALLGALESLAENTDPCHNALRWQIIGKLSDLGSYAAAAVPMIERIIADDVESTWTAAGVLALAKITGDRGRAEQLLDGYMTEPTVRRAARRIAGHFPTQILAWLCDNGGLAERHAEFVERLARAEPRRLNPRALAVLWRARGAQVAELVRTTLVGYIEDDIWGPLACEVLAEMGADASDALPALDGIIERTHRLGFHIGDLDAELRADEQLLTAALAARKAIIGT